ncbi:MAG: tRNA (adenosine(37)-N6)-threonylcarbamoyltransferase complex dimerization subunit type 1 TsaB [Geminicoccaceae bacterium]
MLAFDTSGPAIAAVAVDAGLPLAWRDEGLGRGHAERLLPLLSDLLAEARWSWRDVEVVAVGTGPGNFTGIRAGLAVARSLGLAVGCRCLGVSSLDLLAESATSMAPGHSPIDAVIDARRDEIYAQRFNGEVLPATEPLLVPAAEFAAILPGPGILVGDAAAELARSARKGDPSIPGARDSLTLAHLVGRRLARGEAAAPAGSVRPTYIRSPDARPNAGASLIHAGR